LSSGEIVVTLEMGSGLKDVLRQVTFYELQNKGVFFLIAAVMTSLEIFFEQ